MDNFLKSFSKNVSYTIKVLVCMSNFDILESTCSNFYIFIQ